jgi:hypothetical protein
MFWYVKESIAFCPVGNFSKLKIFLHWKFFYRGKKSRRLPMFKKNNRHESKTIRPIRLFCNSYIEPYHNPQLDSVKIQKRVELR